MNLGPHPPRLWPEDVDLVHEMWLEVSDQYAGSKVHHRDIVGVALRRMRKRLEFRRSGTRSCVMCSMNCLIEARTPVPENLEPEKEPHRKERDSDSAVMRYL